MSYTTIEQVRHHLVSEFPTPERITDSRIVMPESDFIIFAGVPVEPASVRVKSLRSLHPQRKVTALADGRASIAAAPLVPGSVVVASDTSLGTVYTENTDYVVEPITATITAKGAALAPDQDIAVWYLTYHLYMGDTDYLLSPDLGQLKRLPAGSIAPGETVYIDYTPVLRSYDDTILKTAVSLANGLVEREVDPGREFGADPALNAAATCRALEIVCRSAATRELSRRLGQDRPALAWLKLAEAFAATADRLITSFRPPRPGPASPAHS
jgi:hypothetical protein